MAAEKGSRLRKRSLRHFEPDILLSQEEAPPKKRTRLSTPVEENKHRNGKRGRILKSSPVGKLRKGKDSELKSHGEGRRQGKKLLVSLNIQDNDLQLSTGLKSAPRSRGKGRGRQRCQSVGSDAGSSNGSMESGGSSLNFKNPKFTCSSGGLNRKKGKNLKQILSSEKAAGMNPNVPTYASIDAPPSFKPAKKYSDLSGLLANYTDPLTRLYYSTVEEFQIIRTLPQDIVQGHLALRGKMTIT